MRYFLRFLLIILFPFFFISNLSAQTAVLSLKGYLGKEEVASAVQTLEKASKDDVRQLVIELDSASGKLKEVLEFAKDIYALKAEKRTKIIVYIQDNAIGPAAIVPFLADEIYLSFFVSWGDIPLGSEGVLPTNILRNTVKSFITTDNPNSSVMHLMAEAMTDPSLQVVDEEGWKIAKGNYTKVISSPGETLVVNHNQLKELRLVSGMMSLSTFRSRFAFTEVQVEEIRAEEQKAETILLSPVELVQELEKYISFDAKETNTVGLIKIVEKTQISQATWIYVKSALDYYKKNPPRFVILELNTPGGEVFSSQKISDGLKDLDTQFNIPVVAFINNWAISAGAMLAYSCRFITVTKDASMGAAEPVQAGKEGMVTASEKVNSALRADFANRAGFFDRNSDIAEAMVDKDIILVKRHGRIVRLDNKEAIRTTGPDPDILISAKGKLLTFSTEQLIEYGVADILLAPKKTELITESEKEKGKWSASKMLLFQHSFFNKIPNAVVDMYRMDWKTQFLALLSNPMVSSLLFLGMLLGFYVEINSPGIGFPGSVALLCLFLIVLSSFALEVANILEVVLLLVGLVFIALDLFLIPTFGMLGIVGVIFFFIGLFGMMLPGIGTVDFEFDTQTFNAAGEEFVRRLGWLCGTLVLGVVMIAMLGRYVMPTFKGFRRFVLEGHEETAANGYFAGADPSTLPQPGSKGEVLATLRPAGKVIINDEIYDAITVGEFVEQGTPVVVVRLDGSVIVVDKQVKEE